MTLNVAALNEVTLSLPSSAPGESYTCREVNNSRSDLTEFFVNVSNSASIDVNTGYPIQVTQMYYYRTSRVMMVILNVNNLISLGTGGSVPFSATNSSHMRVFSDEMARCAAYSDTYTWSGKCVCPLDTIGNAVAVASITFLILYPVKLIQAVRKLSQTKQNDDALTHTA